ncbi:MAG: FGGY-family carbohydrate kinase [Clostridia bacterium]|nr:FGGY-family carbohydrate kinase [Clostridia bacterium]
MVQPLILGVDFGTQGVRTAIFKPDGRCLKMAFASYDTYYPHPGWAEQQPQEWWEAFTKALANCLDKVDSTQIAGMTVCGTASTVVAMARDGNPLMPAILWMDTRAASEAEKINSTRHKILKYSGGQDSVEWMLPKTLWIKENKPEVYHQTYQIMEQLDWINYRLTNQLVSSKCTVTCKWNYADVEDGWSDEFMKEIGLGDFREKIPVKVLPIGEKVGTMTAETAAQLGLPPGIMVYQGGIDAHIGMLGLGVVSPGQMGVIMGTSFVHLALTEQPIYHQGLWGPYPSAVIEGLWLLEGGQVSAGSLTRWFKDQLAGDLQYIDPDPYQILADQAKDIPPGAEGLMVLDTWQGNRTPYRDPLTKGAILGLTLSHTRAHLYRAILEGVAFGTRNILEAFKEADCPVKEMVACGGVLKNPVWLQIIADVTGVPIRRTTFSEAGVLGCAIAAAAGMKYYNGLAEATQTMVDYSENVLPNPDNALIYDFYFKSYKQTYEVLAPEMHRIHNFNNDRR